MCSDASTHALSAFFSVEARFAKPRRLLIQDLSVHEATDRDGELVTARCKSSSSPYIQSMCTR